MDFEEWDGDLDQYVQTGYYIAGWGADEHFVVTNKQKSLLERERKVIENCLLVRDAVEAFAAANNGVYPWLTTEELPSGDSVILLLPNGRLLSNPFLNVQDSPVDGGAAASGQVGFVARDINGDGVPDGYTIDGLGYNLCVWPFFVIEYPPD